MSRGALALLTAVLCCVVVDAAPGQRGRARKVRGRHRTAAALHSAWLQENLDLDSRGAIQSYEKLRQTAPKTRPERWLAVARLAELGRLGVIHPEPGTMPMQAPLEVQKALEKLGQPVPWQNVISDPTAEVELPRLRPATERIMLWGRDQVGPTVNQRWLMQMRARDRSGRGDTSWQNRNAAFTLLDVELEGTSDRAESLRSVMFVGWKPPVLDVGIDDALKRAGDRLRGMIERERSSRYRPRLEALQKRVLELTERDRREALALLMRLPFLAEELLLPPKEEQPQQPEGGREERRNR